MLSREKKPLTHGPEVVKRKPTGKQKSGSDQISSVRSKDERKKELRRRKKKEKKNKTEMRRKK